MSALFLILTIIAGLACALGALATEAGWFASKGGTS